MKTSDVRVTSGVLWLGEKAYGIAEIRVELDSSARVDTVRLSLVQPDDEVQFWQRSSDGAGMIPGYDPSELQGQSRP